MSKYLLFYLIDEHTNETVFCKKRGLIPCKYEKKICYSSDNSDEDYVFYRTIQYVDKRSKCVYDVLDKQQCYSGFNTTLMRQPKLMFDDLIKTAITSKNRDERIGSIGILLKDYQTDFEKYLSNVIKTQFSDIKTKKRVKWMAVFITDYIWKNTSFVWHLESIKKLCEKIKQLM